MLFEFWNFRILFRYCTRQWHFEVCSRGHLWLHLVYLNLMYCRLIGLRSSPFWGRPKAAADRSGGMNSSESGSSCQVCCSSSSGNHKASGSCRSYRLLQQLALLVSIDRLFYPLIAFPIYVCIGEPTVECHSATNVHHCWEDTPGPVLSSGFTSSHWIEQVSRWFLIVLKIEQTEIETIRTCYRQMCRLCIIITLSSISDRDNFIIKMNAQFCSTE